jgi:hypothetical protein
MDASPVSEKATEKTGDRNRKDKEMSRRSMAVAIYVLALGGVSNGVMGFQATSVGQLRGRQHLPVKDIQKIKESLYMVTGGAGNTAVFITERGVVLVDTKDPGSGPAICERQSKNEACGG